MKPSHLTTLLTAAVLLAAATSALAQTSVNQGVLRDAQGRTLYTFDSDRDGESRCHDGCAVAWPPFMAAEGAVARAPLTLHPRKGGGQQWGHLGRPLYRFAGDAKAGDTDGDGKGGTWHVVRERSGDAAARPTASASDTANRY